MNFAETVLLNNIDNPNSCFIFPTEVAASRWADHLLRLRGGTIAMNKFIAWDVFKQNSIRSQVQNKKSIPSALRKIFVSRLIRENAELCKENQTPVLSSLIRPQWAGQAAQFTSWLTGLLPQLGAWFTKTTGLQTGSILSRDAEQRALQFDGDDRDLYTLAARYAHFLDAHGLFEPAWETPPFNDTETQYFLFFPESLSDYSEYRELLAASGNVKTINAENTENLPCDTFFYTNARSEITEAALYIRALHEKQGIGWDSIAVSIPDTENYEPYVLREFANRNIPFVKRSGKPLSDYPAGQFFRSVLDCTSRGCAFSALAGLVLNRNLPWENTAHINNLIEFGIANNCISSWVEEKDGKEQTINVWEDAFSRPYGWYDPEMRKFFSKLKQRLYSLRTAASFAELRRQYFIFRESFFNMKKCTDETNLILSRCISELMYLVELEKDFPDVQAADPFLFFTEYLGEVNYLAQQAAGGVTILPYRTAAPAPFDCHIVLGANQSCLSVVFSRLDFLPRAKREKLGIVDEDASAAFINLHRYNSLKTTAFFCCEHDFSGYTIPHSRINAPSKPKERYASEPELREKFTEDYYRAEFLYDNSKPIKLHENQNKGFEEWSSRRRQTKKTKEKWKTPDVLLELIKSQFTKTADSGAQYRVSASGMEPYFQCSLKWLFGRVLNLENVQIEASLMAENVSGMVYHAILDLFLTELKKEGKPLPPPDCSGPEPALPSACRKLLKQSAAAVFSGFPGLQPGGKPEMSALTARLLRAGKNIFLFKLEKFLVNFLSFFAGCRVTASEAWYQADRGSFFLNGKPDCILEDCREESENKGKHIIVDFKLKWMPSRDDCIGDGEKGLSNFQLPMYISLAEENEEIKVYTALFYSIIDSKPEVIFGTIQDVNTDVIIPKKEGARILRENEEYKRIIKEFIKKTEQFANEIQTGSFTVFESDYNECNECDYHRICRTVYKIDRNKNISLGKH